MALSKTQRSLANLIVSIAQRRGLSHRRALELVAASVRESGLNPRATNKSSGAAGLFQLLSRGYRTRAQALGGLYNPRANILAILPAYLAYWKSHPKAAAGQAAAAVEASGQSANWYAQPLSYLLGYGFNGASKGGRGTVPQPSPLMDASRKYVAPANPGNAMLAARQAASQQLLDNLVHGDIHHPMSVTQGLGGVYAQALRDYVPVAPPVQVQPSPQNPSGQVVPARDKSGKVHFIPAELFYDPLGGIKYGKQIGAIGGHSDHVHVAYQNPRAVLRAIALARRLGLRVSENPYVGGVDPVHVKNSFHYRDFSGRYNGRRLGEAFDASGSPQAMARLYRYLSRGL